MENNNKKIGVTESSLEKSFFRAIAATLKSHKIGDLLVAAGAISEDQLSKALTLQEATKEPLGKILIRQGVISAALLYRKLAEQWCIKASAAGVALMMQVATPSAARADTTSKGTEVAAQFTLAAAMPSAGSFAREREFRYPTLFGTAETKSDDISAFRKWTTVMRRFEDEMGTSASKAPRIMQWRTEIRRLQNTSRLQQVEAVNDYINQVRYIEDKNAFGRSDYWATPIEFLSRGGDCEDFAIAKYASLRALGFSSEQLRIAVVEDQVKKIHHAILIVYLEDGAYVLDNQDKALKPMRTVSRYKPIFSINSTHWWLHNA